MDPNPHRESDSVLSGKILVQCRYGSNDSKSSANRRFGVVSARLRISKVNDQAVAEILSDMTSQPGGRSGGSKLILSRDVMPFLRIEPCCDFC
jgi:hypothetical protein